MITTKQRAVLRGMANSLKSTVQIGKSGVTEQVCRQAEEALLAGELVKFTVLETAMLTPREAAGLLSRQLGAEIVQVIGKRFILYRENPDKKDRLMLP